MSSNGRRVKNRPGAVLFHDDFQLIRNELTVEEMGQLFDAVMTYSAMISDRKKVDDEAVERSEPIIDADDVKLQLYFRFLAGKVKTAELDYRETGRINAENRQKGIEKQKGRGKP